MWDSYQVSIKNAQAASAEFPPGKTRNRDPHYRGEAQAVLRSVTDAIQDAGARSRLVKNVLVPEGEKIDQSHEQERHHPVTYPAREVRGPALPGVRHLVPA